MENNQLIEFDTTSGFSIEEQQEILNKINSLNVEKGIIPGADQYKSEARKKWFLFPLLVNLFAVILLAGGFLLLWFYHNRDEQEIRTGSAVLGVTERRLIQEIRRDTMRLLGEKESEIDNILSRLAGVTDEYRLLELSYETLSEEQQLRAESLLNQQREYRNSLSALQNERSQILEDSRVRETLLRTQADETTAQLFTRAEQSQAGLNAAADELSILAAEQERIVFAESQLSWYYTMLNSLIEARDFDQALEMIEIMKAYLDTPLFMNSRFETRRRMHITAVGMIEEAIDGFSFSQSRSDNTENLAALQSSAAEMTMRISELEQVNRNHEEVISILGSQGTDQGRAIANYSSRISSLETQVSNQQYRLAERENSIQSLSDEITEHRLNIAELTLERTALNDQVREQQGIIDSTRRMIGDRDVHIAENNRVINTLTHDNEELTRQNEILTRRIETFQQQALQALDALSN